MIINVNTMVNLPVEKVWEYWTEPAHIVNWNYASEDWHTTKVTNDLRVGGKFSSRMEAKNGSVGFDFSGFHKEVKASTLIASVLGDGRMMRVTFVEIGGKTLVTEDFEAETENSIEMQRNGWQAILDNFKNYAERHGV